MMEKKAIVIFVCILLITICVTPVIGEIITQKNEAKNEQKNVNDTKSSPTSYTRIKFMIAGKAIRCFRSYWLHLPPSYDGLEAVPLVIVLHGATGFNLKKPLWFFRKSWMENYTEFSKKADEEGFIVVYPTAKLLPLYSMYGYDHEFHPKWIYKFTDDVGFINDLIEKMEEEYNINSSRIYITGFSNGAVMSYSLGSYLSDKFAAIAPVAGTIGYRVSESEPIYQIPVPTNPVSVIAFHGTNDSSAIPYDGSLFSVSVNESIAFWVENNGCDPAPEINISESGKIIRRTYKEGDNGTDVVLYTTIGGEHWWPGNKWTFNPGTPWWLGDTIQEISATDLIWEFFESHPKH